MGLRKAGGNWVDGDRFFGREAELEALTERVHDGTHTLLTAQRRMGKTSLVRELLRRLDAERRFETIFVDLEDARTSASAIAEIGVQSRSAKGMGPRVSSWFTNVQQHVSERIEATSAPNVWMDLLSTVIDAGNWRHKGDQIFAAMANSDRRVVLAIDELPIFVNRLLKGDEERTTPERRVIAADFLSWLRKNSQKHSGKVCLILSGSVGLRPILQQAGLSAHANIYSTFDLKPWDEETALACLAALAQSYGLDLPLAVRRDMCRRLRCQVPHHVQLFFDKLHDHLRDAGRREASLEDVDAVYTGAMLGAGGEILLQYYDSRLKIVLEYAGHQIARRLLTEAAANDGWLRGEDIDGLRDDLESFADTEAGSAPTGIGDVLNVLVHDGYLGSEGDGYRFVSGLLEDWWRARYVWHGISPQPLTAVSARQSA